MIHHCRELAAATDLPVSADLEKGKGDSPESAGETIFAAEAAGLAGCSIEDHSGDPENPIYDFNLAVERVAAAVDAARSLKRDFMFTARAENYLWDKPGSRRHHPPPASLRQGRRRRALCAGHRRHRHGRKDMHGGEQAGQRPGGAGLHRCRPCQCRRQAHLARARLANFVYGMLQTSSREMLQDGTFGFTRAAMPFAKLQELFPKSGLRVTGVTTLSVIDMHTGGEPVRIVIGGYPAIPSGTILEKRAWVRDNLDHLRKMLIFEPRGHYDMYGALLVEPDLPGADLAVLFMHNEGYSTMCGHAVIALGRYAVDHGLVRSLSRSRQSTSMPVRAGRRVGRGQRRPCRCGVVRKRASLPVGRRPATNLARHGEIRFDMAYGGAFYALADCSQFGLAFGRDRVRDFVDAATALTRETEGRVPAVASRS